MTEDELKQEAGKWLKDNIRTEKKDGMTFNIVPTPAQIYCAGAEPREKRIAELEDKLANADYQLEGRDLEIKELKAQIEKMKCLNEEIIKALSECLDYEWLPAHNGKAKYLYLQTVIDIVNEKFGEIKEK